MSLLVEFQSPIPKIAKDSVFAKTPILAETLLDDLVLNDLNLVADAGKLRCVSATFSLELSLHFAGFRDGSMTS